MAQIYQLPYLPLSMASLSEMAFFTSNDPRIVRAGFWMLETAWRSPRPGTLPSNFESLSGAARLSVKELEANYQVLTEGWELQGDGRLHHLELEELAQNVMQRFGAELEVIAESAMLACQGGDVEFALAPTDAVKKKIRGKHALPKDFEMDETTRKTAIAEGYDKPELMDWLMRVFKDYAASSDRRQANWQATLRNYLTSKFTRQDFRAKFGYPLGQAPSSAISLGTSPRDRLRQASMSTVNGATFAARTAATNSGMMAAAVQRRDPRGFDAETHTADAPGMHG